MPYNNTHILGTIISSVLDYDSFSAEIGQPDVVDPQKSIWIPCDGRSMDGSKLAKLTKQKGTPDLRGRFLRGLNIIHNPGQPNLNKDYADPDGDNRTPWTYQADAFEVHSHTVPGNSVGTTSGWALEAVGRTSTFYTSPAGTASETRCRNMAVYYYIKVN